MISPTKVGAKVLRHQLRTEVRYACKRAWVQVCKGVME